MQFLDFVDRLDQVMPHRFSLRGPFYDREWQRGDDDYPTGKVKSAWWDVVFVDPQVPEVTVGTVIVDTSNRVTDYRIAWGAAQAAVEAWTVGREARSVRA